MYVRYQGLCDVMVCAMPWSVPIDIYFGFKEFYLFINMRRTGAMDGSIIYYKHFLSEDSIN